MPENFESNRTDSKTSGFANKWVSGQRVECDRPQGPGADSLHGLSPSDQQSAIEAMAFLKTRPEATKFDQKVKM
jgi:hypothetical protein